MLYLCNVAGGHAAFDPFFREYIKTFSFKTVTSEVGALAFVLAFVLAPALAFVLAPALAFFYRREHPGL